MIDKSLKVVLATGKKLTVWDLNSPSKLVEVEIGCEVTSLRGQVDTLHCTTSDNNLVNVCKTKLTVTGCSIVNNDEVLDLVMMGETNTHLAAACNSPIIRLYSRDTWNCEMANGHTDTVLCLATCPGDTSLMASGGRDREVRVWRLEQ